MFRSKALIGVVSCLSVLVGTHSASAEVRLTIDGGRVTLSAKNATVAQILAEWAKVGQTRIVNAERVGGDPITLELSNVSEADAIEVVLRSAGGYVLAPRRTAAPNASAFDRILILPPSSPVVNAPRVAAAQPVPQQPRPFISQQPGQAAVQPANDDNDEPPERTVVAPAQPARAPVFNTFPQVPQPRDEAPAPPAPTSSVTAPAGVAVPGMVVPTPQASQPGAVSPPQQPQR